MRNRKLEPSGSSSEGRDEFGKVVNLSSAEVRQWTIKGIQPSAVEVSREAAKRSGMKLNSWVSRALQRAAEDASIEQEGSSGSSLSFAEFRDYIEQEMSKLKQQNDQLESTMNSISSILLKMYTKDT